MASQSQKYRLHYPWPSSSTWNPSQKSVLALATISIPRSSVLTAYHLILRPTTNFVYHLILRPTATLAYHLKLRPFLKIYPGRSSEFEMLRQSSYLRENYQTSFHFTIDDLSSDDLPIQYGNLYPLELVLLKNHIFFLMVSYGSYPATI